MLFTVHVPDNPDVAEYVPQAWIVTCDHCGAELPHEPTDPVQVFRVKNLTAEARHLLEKRLELLQGARSLVRTLILDAEDEYDSPSKLEQIIREHAKACPGTCHRG